MTVARESLTTLFTRKTYRITRRPDGVCVVWIDALGRAHNRFDAAFADALRRACDDVDADSTVRGVVIASSKPDEFMAGSDLNVLERCETVAEARLLARHAQRVVAWLESLKKPVVAAVHGACLDAGLEVVLACDGCVCSDDSRTLLGSGQIHLGLMPFAGGTARLPRRVGLRRALDMLLTGRALRAHEARRAGLVERVVPAGALIDAAAQHALQLSTSAETPTALFDWKIASGRFATSRSIKNSLARALLFARARRCALARHVANELAPCRIIDVLRVGLDEGFEAGLAAEARAFGDLAVGYAARHLMALERARTELALESAAHDPNDPVRRPDVALDSSVRRLDAKRATLRSVEQVTPSGTVFATETAGLSVAKIAQASVRPESVVGVHDALPTKRAGLLEVVTTPRTGSEAVTACAELGWRQEKTVVVVRDAPGAYTLRILAPCVLEALHLLSEGARAEQIDGALERFGFSVQPLQFLDALGLDVFSRARAELCEALGGRMGAPQILDALLADGRFGCACGRGVYRYDAERRGAEARLGRRLGLGRPIARPSAKEIIGRAALRFVNEAVLCLSDGVVKSPRDGDVAAVLGAGFPAFRGGPFAWVDTFGARGIVERLARYQAAFGARFEPAPALVEMAAQGLRFYPSEAPALRVLAPGLAKAAPAPLEARAHGW